MQFVFISCKNVGCCTFALENLVPEFKEDEQPNEQTVVLVRLRTSFAQYRLISTPQPYIDTLRVGTYTYFQSLRLVHRRMNSLEGYHHSSVRIAENNQKR